MVLLDTVPQILYYDILIWYDKVIVPWAGEVKGSNDLQ